jgi:hypothetical protein
MPHHHPFELAHRTRGVGLGAAASSPEHAPGLRTRRAPGVTGRAGRIDARRCYRPLTVTTPPALRTDPATLVDLERYPLLTPEHPRYQAAVAEAQRQMRDSGAAEIDGFLHSDALSLLVADAEALAPRAHHSGGEGTAYLEFPDFSLPPDHPRLHFAPYSVGAVGYDVIPRTSLLRLLYEWDPMKDFIQAALERGPIYRYGDPFGALNLAVMGEGEQLQWHFDQTDFVVSLAIQSAERGGDFEVVPRIRRADDERYDDVAAVLSGEQGRVETLAMTPGTLLLFEGRYSLHRVSPIGGAQWRHVGLLAYDTKPGTVGSDLLRADRYGRTEPFDEPPETWPAAVTNG